MTTTTLQADWRTRVEVITKYNILRSFVVWLIVSPHQNLLQQITMNGHLRRLSSINILRIVDSDFIIHCTVFHLCVSFILYFTCMELRLVSFLLNKYVMLCYVMLLTMIRFGGVSINSCWRHLQICVLLWSLLIRATRVLFEHETTRVIFYHSSTRLFLFPVENFISDAVFAVIWRIAGIGVKFGPRYFICNSQPGAS